MSKVAMDWAFEQNAGDAQPTLLMLAYSADPQGISRPSVGWLRHVLKLGERTVQRHLQQLVDLGLAGDRRSKP